MAATSAVRWQAPPEGHEEEHIEFSWAGETARHVGTVVHRWLQRIAEDALRGWNENRVRSLSTRFSRELERRGLPSAEATRSADLVATALNNSLTDERGRWLLGPHLEARNEYRLRAMAQGHPQKVMQELGAQIATFGRLKAKAAIKDAARVLDHGFAISDRITKALPADVMGKGVPLKEIFNPEHKRYNDGGEFRALYEQDAEVRTIYQTALGLEGQIRNWGVHAAGVIMSSEPLIDIVPIMKREQDGAIITQFDYPMCESLGLVKMDFLGLRNLTGYRPDGSTNARDAAGEPDNERLEALEVQRRWTHLAHRRWQGPSRREPREHP